MSACTLARSRVEAGDTDSANASPAQNFGQVVALADGGMLGLAMGCFIGVMVDVAGHVASLVGDANAVAMNNGHAVAVAHANAVDVRAVGAGV